MTRYEAIAQITETLQPDDLAIFTTGMISREAFTAGDRPTNLYVIGSMGLASALGAGAAMAQPDRRVFVFDGDGSLLMSLGNVPMIAREAPSNLRHVILDNEVYGSTGNQPSMSRDVDLGGFSEAAGYRWCMRVDTKEQLAKHLPAFLEGPGPTFLLVKVDTTEVRGIGRVTLTPEQLADRFRAAAVS